MKRKVDISVMGFCNCFSNITGYEDIKNQEYYFEEKHRMIKFIIVSIDLYTLGDDVYCYQVQTQHFKGFKFLGLFLNNFYEDDFSSFIKFLRA